MTDAEFTAFVLEFRVKAISMATRMLKSSEDAQDAVQEAFIRAHAGLDKFRGDASVSTWFYRILYTTCLNMLRKQRRLPMHERLDDDESVAWIEPDVFETIDKATIDEVLREEMASMSPLYAVVIDLFYVQECSYEQIVKVTGMPLGTVKTRLNRGRTLLKEAVHART